ncbi:hypothetical protein HX109_06065 [Galbibacter sp. BG1]|uniref:hypothetical protein n=1 Tax=Galbibacter sp. BG1 TaxID=1170699 RepID=UPI0015BBDA62|nr:hypothetical protein [Galbibacter sp. BG1]QLE01149.1 hypothetical protein HX109_06065 [Galbibacter sp. BG1]
MDLQNIIFGAIILIIGVFLFIFMIGLKRGKYLKNRDPAIDGIIEIKGFVGGILLILAGAFLIYNEIASYFGWTVLFMDK